MFLPSRKIMQQGGSVASDAVMASVAKGSLVAHTNEVQTGGAKRRVARRSAKLNKDNKANSKSLPLYRQCGGSIASDAVQALVPESAMHLHTNLFCPPEHPLQLGAGKWGKAEKAGRRTKRQQKGGNILYGLSLPAAATGDMAKSLAVPPSGFMDISPSMLSKMAAYPECLYQSKFIFGGVQDGSGRVRRRTRSASGKKAAARKSSTSTEDCQCGGMNPKKSLPKPQKKPAQTRSAANKPKRA